MYQRTCVYFRNNARHANIYARIYMYNIILFQADLNLVMCSTHTQKHIRMHVLFLFTHTHQYIYLHTHTQCHTHPRVNHTRICKQACIQIWSINISIGMLRSAVVHLPTYMLCIHVCTRTHKHTHTHTHTHNQLNRCTCTYALAYMHTHLQNDLCVYICMYICMPSFWLGHINRMRRIEYSTNVHTCINTHTQIDACTRTHKHLHTHTNVCVHMYTCTYVYTYISSYKYEFPCPTHVHSGSFDECTHTNSYTHTQTHTHTHTNTHVDICTNTQRHTHAHTHTHTRTYTDMCTCHICIHVFRPFRIFLSYTYAGWNIWRHVFWRQHQFVRQAPQVFDYASLVSSP